MTRLQISRVFFCFVTSNIEGNLWFILLENRKTIAPREWKNARSEFDDFYRVNVINRDEQARQRYEAPIPTLAHTRININTPGPSIKQPLGSVDRNDARFTTWLKRQRYGYACYVVIVIVNNVHDLNLISCSCPRFFFKPIRRRSIRS